MHDTDDTLSVGYHNGKGFNQEREWLFHNFKKYQSYLESFHLWLIIVTFKVGDPHIFMSELWNVFAGHAFPIISTVDSYIANKRTANLKTREII